MDTILNEHSMELLVSVITFVVGWIWRRYVSKKQRQTIAMQALEAAVHDTWIESVRLLKRKAEDGKISGAERESLRINTTYNARSIAKAQGVDLLKELGEYNVPVIIHNIINERKRQGSDD